MSAVKTLFADFNARDADGAVRLDSPADRAAIRAAGALPGERVRLSDGEIAVEALLKWSAARGHWGVPNWASIVYLDDPAATTASG